MTRVVDSKTTLGNYEKFSIRELLPRHFRVIDMIVADHGTKVIAETLGMTERSIAMIRKSPLVQQEVARRRKEDKTNEVLGMDRDAAMGKARSILDQALEPAAQKIADLAQGSQDESIQFRSAQFILEMAFGKSGQGTQIGTVINVSAEHVQLLNQAIKESNNECISRNQPNSAPASPTERGQIDVH